MAGTAAGARKGWETRRKHARTRGRRTEQAMTASEYSAIVYLTRSRRWVVIMDNVGHLPRAQFLAQAREAISARNRYGSHEPVTGLRIARTDAPLPTHAPRIAKKQR